MLNTTSADRITANQTAYDSFADLVTACRSGYVPTLRGKATNRLGFMLEGAGCKVYWK